MLALVMGCCADLIKVDVLVGLWGVGGGNMLEWLWQVDTWV